MKSTIYLQRQLRFRFSDAYHSILSMSWPRFLFFAFAFYLVVNFMFAVVYFACGPEALSGLSTEPNQRLLDTFFFSEHILSTIGFGQIFPATTTAYVIVTFESIIGLMFLALLTGIMFSRFSRPTARVVFSKVAVVNSHDGIKSFLFRIGNERLNQIVEARVGVTLVIDEKTKEGDTYRTFHDLELERSQSPLFALTWTVVHPIDQKSPLFDLKVEDLARQNAEILVSVSGIDDTFAQSIYSRHSYLPHEIRFEHKFVDIIKRTPESLFIDMENIHTAVPLQTGQL